LIAGNHYIAKRTGEEVGKTEEKRGRGYPEKRKKQGVVHRIYISFEGENYFK